MSPKYRLTYFNARGASEHIRLIFSYAGVEFEDIRVQDDKWPEMKDETPFGKLPMLEVDGKKVSQSIAISRYLANEFNLLGKDNMEKFKCDELVASMVDLALGMSEFFREPDEVKREEMKDKYLSETFRHYMKRFEKIVKSNGGFTVGNSLTWSDFVFASFLELFEHGLRKDILYLYPSLKGLQVMIHQLPGVKKWINKRPQTTF